MGKTLGVIVMASALALAACGEEQQSKVAVPDEFAEGTTLVFRTEYFVKENAVTTETEMVIGYDTDGDPRTIEEALVLRNYHEKGAPSLRQLRVMSRGDWRHLLAPGVAPKRYVTDNTATMSPREQAALNAIAQQLSTYNKSP